MKSLAVELASEGIRVNCVCPGGVDTPLSAHAVDSVTGDIDVALFVRMTGVLPGGMMPPAHIADVPSPTSLPMPPPRSPAPRSWSTVARCGEAAREPGRLAAEAR